MPSKKLKEATLLDAVVALSTGTWVEVTAWNRISIWVTGITIATLKVMAWNGPTKPSDATDGPQVGADITADGLTSIAIKIKWIKVKVSAYTSGTITSTAIGDETAYGL